MRMRRHATGPHRQTSESSLHAPRLAHRGKDREALSVQGIQERQQDRAVVRPKEVEAMVTKVKVEWQEPSGRQWGHPFLPARRVSHPVANFRHPFGGSSVCSGSRQGRYGRSEGRWVEGLVVSNRAPACALRRWRRRKSDAMRVSITDPRVWAWTHPCSWCGKHLGCSQYRAADGTIVTEHRGYICDSCYDRTYPTPETSTMAKHRKSLNAS